MPLRASKANRFQARAVLTVLVLSPWLSQAQTTVFTGPAVTSTFTGEFHNHIEEKSNACSFAAPPTWAPTGNGLKLDTSLNCPANVTAAIHINVTISPAMVTGIPGTRVGDEYLFALRTAFTTDITANVALSGNGVSALDLDLSPPDNGGQCKELNVMAASAHLACTLTPNPGPREESLARDLTSSPPRDYFSLQVSGGFKASNPAGASYSFRFYLTPQFSEGAAPDAISLTNVDPTPGSNLKAQSSQPFTAIAQYSLNTADHATITLELSDQSGNSVAKSMPVSVDRGSSSTPLTIPAFALPPNIQTLTLKGVLRPSGGAARESTAITYPIPNSGDLAITYIQPVQVIHNFPPPQYAGPAGSEYKWQEMPFIAGKTTMVRVWIKNIGNNPTAVGNVTAVLHGFATGVTSPNSPDPLTPVSKPITALPYTGPLPLQSPPDFDEATVDFYLPQDWVKADGAITIQVDIVLPMGFPDADLTNNSVTRTIALQKQPSGPGALTPGRLRVGWMPICQPLPDGATACPSNNIGNYWEDFAKWFPVADGGVDFIRVDNQQRVYPSLVQSLTQNQQMLTNYLRPLKASLEENDLLQFDFLIGFLVDTTFPGIAAAPTVVGLCPDQTGSTPKNAPCLPGGLADAIFAHGTGQVALVTDYGSLSSNLARFSTQNVAHELGHLMGLEHVIAKTTGKGNVGSGGCDDNAAVLVTGCNNWPYLDPTIQFMGYDTTLYRKHPASANYDLMSYCTNSGDSNMWISPYSFVTLFNNNLAPSDAPFNVWNSCKLPAPEPLPNIAPDSRLSSERPFPASAPPGRRAGPPNDLAILTGTVQADGSRAALAPVFHLRTTAAPSLADPAGAYCLQFADANGSSLGSFCFGLTFKDGETNSDIASAGFSFLLPLPAGTAAIALTNKGSAIASVTAGAQPPAVSIQSPQPGDNWPAGMQTVSWSGSGSGSAPPTYMVAYSNDGGTRWSPLLAPTTATQFTIDPATLNGGANVFFRVTVSDGVLNSVATVGPITISQSASASLPPGPVDFRNGLLGTAVKREVLLSNNGSGPLHVSAVTFDSAAFRMTAPLPPFDVYPGNPATLKLTFTAVAPGPASGHMTVTSSDPANPALALDLKGNGIASTAPDAAVSPDKVDFGDAPLNNPVSRTVTLQSFGPASLSVKSVVVSGTGFSLPKSLGPLELAVNDTQPIVVQFSAQHIGAHTGALTIATDDPAHSTITVPLSGNGTSGTPPPGPAISVTPTSLDFGGVTLGTSQTKTVTIANTGNAALNVAALTAAAPFSVVSPAPPISVPAGASSAVTVQFAPTAAGTQSGALSIASNDAAKPSLIVNLTGSGVAGGGTSNIVRTLGYHEITRFPKEVRFSNGGMPVLSAGGGRVVYAHAPGDETDARYNHIFVVNVDGSGQREVDVYKQNCYCGAIVDISADGNTVVSTDGAELRAASAAGSAGKRLIANREIPYVRISPKGDKVFFVNRRGEASASDPTTERGLYVINIDGSGLKQIAGPKAVAALLGTTADKVFPFATNGWSLDVSADGTKLVFGAAAPGGERIFAVNADGSSLRQALGPVDFVNHAALSGDGSKVGYDVIPPPCCSTPNEVGVVNADGSNRKSLAAKTPDIGGGNRMEMSGDGTQLLYGGTSYLYAVDGSGVVQLSSRGGYYSSDSAPLVTDGFGQPTMNSLATRFLYVVRDAAGIPQLATLDINPAALGDAPSITAASLTQPSIPLNGGGQSIVSAMVATANTITRVSAAVLGAGITDPNVAAPVMLDDGTNGDQVAGDGIYTGRISANCCAATGPKTVRVKAEVRDSGNRRHATAIEFGGLTVVPNTP